MSNTSNAIGRTKATNLETSFIYSEAYVYILPKSGGAS